MTSSHAAEAPVAATADSSKTAGSKSRVVRPDRVAFNARIDDLTKEIDAVKEKLDKAKEAINGSSSNEKGSDEKQELNDKIEAVRSQMSAYNQKREMLLSQLKKAQDTTKSKITEIKNTKDKLDYRSTAEIDRKLAEIDAQVSSGLLKVTEEKRMLSEASALRKHRKTIEALGPQEGLIESEKARADMIRKELDAMKPDGKVYKDQLDELFAKLRVIQASRSESSKQWKSLRGEREDLSKKLSALLQERRDAHADFKTQRDEWDAFYKEEKARKDAEYKAQREETARARKLEGAQQALEEAALPAFEKDIHTCNALTAMLNGYLGKSSEIAATGPVKSSASANSRQVGDNPALPKGVKSAVLLKKKSDRMDEESFIQLKKKPAASTANAATAADKKGKESLKFDLQVINQFLKLKIDVPTKVSEIPAVVTALGEKKQYFLDNQDRVTKENIEKAKKKEADILKAIEEHGALAAEVPEDDGAVVEVAAE